MFDMMNQAANAIQVYDTALRVHNANIANLSVTGYKRLDISFQSVLDRMMSPGSGASLMSNLGGTNPKQFGQGVGIANVGIDFTAGAFANSTNEVDLGITGQGLFIVSNDGGSTYQYTRAGKFTKDKNNNLVTQTGMQVYGLNSSGAITPITGLTSDISQYTWSEGSGELQLKNGTSTGFRIALTYFNNAGGLQQTSGTTFTETLASGSAATPTAPGGTAGTVSKGKVEQSNVFYLGESIEALEINRAISANLTSVKAASDLISSFISKLG